MSNFPEMISEISYAKTSQFTNIPLKILYIKTLFQSVCYVLTHVVNAITAQTEMEFRLSFRTKIYMTMITNRTAYI